MTSLLTALGLSLCARQPLASSLLFALSPPPPPPPPPLNPPFIPFFSTLRFRTLAYGSRAIVGPRMQCSVLCIKKGMNIYLSYIDMLIRCSLLFFKALRARVAVNKVISINVSDVDESKYACYIRGGNKSISPTGKNKSVMLTGITMISSIIIMLFYRHYRSYVICAKFQKLCRVQGTFPSPITSATLILY